MANRRNKGSKKGSGSRKSTLATAEIKLKRDNDKAVQDLLKSFGYKNFDKSKTTFDDANSYTVKSDQDGNKKFVNTGTNGGNSKWPLAAHIILSLGAERIDVKKQANEKDAPLLSTLKSLFEKNNRKETFLYQPTEACEFENLKYRKFRVCIDENKDCKIEQVGEEDLLKNLITRFNEASSVDIESLITKKKDVSSVRPEQIIYFGAPGTGKSYKVNQQVNRKGLLEKEFYDYLHTDAPIDAKSADDYCSYCKTFENKAPVSFFDYVDPLSLADWKEKYKDVWDTKYWGPVLTCYIQFLKKRSSTRIFRTTFHPDYDYCQFVGAYKPKKREKSDEITYEFVPQVFAKAYVSAWRFYLSGNNEPVFLIIEEINRGNCAQIFGDIFQLLDRNEKGFSQYSIECDSDLYEWLKKEFVLKDDVFWKKIKLPPNLHILATMNTSDQSLFPMDSAFKRRFDWEYVPINYEHSKAHFAIEVGGKKYDWLDFLKKINDNIDDVTKSEDKKLGEFFIKPKAGKTISFEDFRSKVLFYLWDSIYKDEEGSSVAEEVFHFKIDGNEKNKMTFQKLFEKKDGVEKGIEYVNMIMGKLKIEDWKDDQNNVGDSAIKLELPTEKEGADISAEETQILTEQIESEQSEKT